MIIHVKKKNDITLFGNYMEFKFLHKLLVGVSLGGAITHMLPGYHEKELFEEMLKKFETINNQLNEKKIML